MNGIATLSNVVTNTNTTSPSASPIEGTTLPEQLVPIFYPTQATPSCSFGVAYVTPEQAQVLLLSRKTNQPFILPNPSNFPRALNKNQESLDDSSKRRLRPSDDQCDILWKTFNENPLPSAAIRQKLASQLGMSPRAVQIWFQNRRQWFRTKGVSEMNSKNGPRSGRKTEFFSRSPSPVSNETNLNSISHNTSTSNNNSTTSSPNSNNNSNANSPSPSFSNLDLLANIVESQPQAKRWRPWM